MYHSSIFQETDQAKIIAFMASHPFALITGVSIDNQLRATQVPLLLEELDGELFLKGHLMKASDHYKTFLENPNVLVVFTGPKSYVSATWYKNRNSASTWNYMSVHCKGTIEFLNETQLENIMQETTLHFEQGNHESPTVYNNLPNSYKERLIKAIVGFKIRVNELDHVFKLSQNQDQESFKNIISELNQGDAHAQEMAREMSKLEDDLFK